MQGCIPPQLHLGTGHRGGSSSTTGGPHVNHHPSLKVIPQNEELWRRKARKAWDDFLGDGSRLLSDPLAFPQLSQGWLGLHFWQPLQPRARLEIIEFLGMRKRQAVRVVAWLECGALPATALASPGYQGYQHFPVWVLFFLALPPWICWYSQLGSPSTEELM